MRGSGYHILWNPFSLLSTRGGIVRPRVERGRERERETSDSPYIKTSTHLVRRVLEVLGESSYVFSQPSSLLSTPGDIVQSRVFVACGACVAMELFLF